MKNAVKTLIVSAILAFSFNTAEASHIAGVDITYKCVGQDSFLITVNVFRDCDGINWNPSSINVSLSSPCGGSFTTTLQTTNQLDASGNAIPIEVSQLCASSISQSTCNNGNLPGMELTTYEGIVVLNPPCNSWEIGFQPPCCRNTAIVNITSTTAYMFTTINNVADSCNNSPKFDVNFPNPYACVGQQICYDYGVTEPDGDSLVYSLITAYANPGTPATYAGGYTPQQPIQTTAGVNLDPVTGKLQFTPTAAGNYVVVVEVCEYDRQTGAQLGCIMRDMQFVIDNCSNQSSTLCQADTIVDTSITGTGTKVNGNTMEVCYGETFCFDVVADDANVNDVLTATSNISQVLSGATMTMTPSGGGNPLTVTFCWTATLSANVFNTFNLRIKDDNCPIVATNTATFNVRVIPGTYAGPDQTICQFSQTAQLEAIGGSSFTWSVLPGGTPNSLSCTNCPDPVASPTNTTSYQVTSNLGTSCKNVDTVKVVVAPDYTLNVTDDTLICSVAPIQLNANPSDPNQTYSYSWNKGQYLDKTNIPDPVANPDESTTFTVTSTSDSGCVKTADVTINISPPFPRDNNIVASDTIICIDDTINLNATLGEVTPSKCGISSNTCVGNTNTQQVGNGTNTNNANSSFGGSDGFPSPFAGENNSAKQQFLYRASDMQAAGMQGGKINAISFFIVSNNGPLVYNNYEIKMKCTNKTELTNNWETGLTVVRNANPIFPPSSGGWYAITLDNPYDWDGQSNLVIEICFNNPSNSQNAVARYTNKSYDAASFFGAGGLACGSFVQDPQSPVQKLPNIRFDVCSGVDANAFSFNWLNPQVLVGGSQATDQSIDLYVDTTTPSEYTVAIADTFGVCFDTVSQNIHVVTKYDVTPDSAGPFCPTSPLYFMNVFTPPSVTHPGGLWTGPGIIDDSLGLFDPGPGGAGLGTHWVKYEITGDACANEDSIPIDVVPPPTPDIISQEPYCELDTMVQIQGVHPQGYFTGGTPFFQKAVVDSSGILDLSQLPQGLDSILVKWTAVIDACSNDSVHELDLTPQFNAGIVSPGSFCNHDSLVRLENVDGTTLDTASFNGHWSGPGIVDQKLGMFDPTVYTPGATAKVYLDSAGMCGNRDSILIQIDTLPDINFIYTQGDKGPYCKGVSQNVVFEGVPEDDPGTIGTGAWKHFNNWLQNPNVTGFNPANTLPRAGVHKSRYIFEDLNGCIDSATFEIEISTAPPAPAGGVYTYCIGDPIGKLVLDTASPTVDTANSFVWYTDEALTDSINTGYWFDLSSEVGSTEGTYFIKQINQAGCASETFGTVRTNVVEPPKVTFSEDRRRGVDPLTVNFNNTTNANNPNNTGERWEWTVYGSSLDPANFQGESAEEHFQYEFPYETAFDPAPGDSGYAVYYVMLRGYNDEGCSDTALQKIVVDAVSELIVPNIFTPNGDGLNDEFAPTVNGMASFEAVIYNRWGRKVAVLDLANPTWDGLDPQTDEIRDGVYYYVINARGNNGKDYNEKGTVTLIK